MSAILNFRGPITGSLKTSRRISCPVGRQHSSRLLSFEIIVFFVRILVTDERTNGQTDGQASAGLTHRGALRQHKMRGPSTLPSPPLLFPSHFPLPRLRSRPI